MSGGRGTAISVGALPAVPVPLRGDRTGIAEAAPFRHTADVRGVSDGVLCVEAALAVPELKSVDAVPDVNAPNPCAFGDDDSRPVNSRHKGESWSPGLSP